jgi:hypothetical protein
MKLKGMRVLKSEAGAALWLVLIISFLSLLLLASAIQPGLQHRQLLEMRLGQLQAMNMVQNGVVYLKSKLALGESFSDKEEITYPKGKFVIHVESLGSEEITAIITGYSERGYQQSYRVKINIDSLQITMFIKI